MLKASNSSRAEKEAAWTVKNSVKHKSKIDDRIKKKKIGSRLYLKNKQGDKFKKTIRYLHCFTVRVDEMCQKI